ncbi:MAG TPA: hypothetical protein VKY19_29755 [Ktedonosporobacter sp.]|jgi:hypothetical protein|nr:hypothetical protein [Ktedonosporobacter sp.]
MKEQPPSKGMRPVISSTMLNFIYWLSMYYPQLLNLRSLSDETILQLIYQFEQSRPDIERYTQQSWLNSIDKLLQGDKYYKDARDILIN